MLGQLPRQVKPDRCLHFPAGDGVLLVVVGEPGGLTSDPLEDVVHEGVHDAHGLGGDASVRVHLLQDLVDVNGIRLTASSSPLLLVSGGLLLAASCGFLSSFGLYFGWHCCFCLSSQSFSPTLMNE